MARQWILTSMALASIISTTSMAPTTGPPGIVGGPGPATLPTTPATPACPYSVIDGKPGSFLVSVLVGTVQYNYEVPCSTGEVFDVGACGCILATTQPVPVTPVTSPTTKVPCIFNVHQQDPNIFLLYSKDRGAYYQYRCPHDFAFDTSACKCLSTISTTPGAGAATTAAPTPPAGVTTSAECPRWAASLPNQFYEIGADNSTQLKDCLIGTFYDANLCVCVVSKEPLLPKCEPNLSLDFNGDFKDISGHGIAVTDVNLSPPVGGVAKFNGRGYLQVWQFQNAPFGDTITLELTFQEDPTGMQIETLVSNCFYNVGSSLEIAVDPVNQAVIFVVAPERFSKQFVNVTYTQVGTPKKVSMFYDGQSLTGDVDGISQTVNFIDKTVDARKASLHLTYGELAIGTCKTFRTFSGSMLNFALYKCDKRLWMNN